MTTVAPATKTNVLAIVALILGIIIPIGGIICGPIALSQIKRTGESGKGLAKAGLIIGIVITAFWVLMIVLSFALAASTTVTTG
ncbi:MAG TPA: DUF4190 domain-containing protein [Mycetocola sp.]|jgi:hypothetical protein|nr:DUF4190 domain-containing protein [Mycetocola sp.]